MLRVWSVAWIGRLIGCADKHVTGCSVSYETKTGVVRAQKAQRNVYP